MKTDDSKCSNRNLAELHPVQNDLPIFMAQARLAWSRHAASMLRSSVVADSMLLRKAMFGALTSVALSASAGQITPPPLPPGSAQVKVVPGQSPEETKKMEKAHKHKDKKDYEHDDSDDDKDKPSKK